MKENLREKFYLLSKKQMMPSVELNNGRRVKDMVLLKKNKKHVWHNKQEGKQNQVVEEKETKKPSEK
jgi:hypothetical protein